MDTVALAKKIKTKCNADMNRWEAAYRFKDGYMITCCGAPGLKGRAVQAEVKQNCLERVCAAAQYHPLAD